MKLLKLLRRLWKDSSIPVWVKLLIVCSILSLATVYGISEVVEALRVVMFP